MKVKNLNRFELISIVIIFFGVALRFYFAAVTVHPGSTDDAGYITVANNLYDGRGWVEDYIFLYGDELPEEVTHPSNTFWMPLANLIIYLFMFITKKSLFFAIIPGIIASGLIGYLTFKFLQRLGLSRIIQISGLILTISIPVLFRESLIPSSRIYYTLFVLLTFYWLYKGFSGNKKYLILSGLAAALSFLTRNDGILLFFILLASIYFLDSSLRKYLIFALLVFILIVTPWLIRNINTFGSINLISGLSLILLKSYEEIYNLHHRTDISEYLSWGLGNIFLSKLKALNKFIWLIISEGNIVIITLAFFGLREIFNSKKIRIALTPYFSFALLFFFLLTFLFTFQTMGGTAGNSIPALIPLFIILALLGLAKIIKTENMQKNLLVLVGIIFLFMSFNETKQNILQNRLLHEKYTRLMEFFKANNIQNPVIMTRYPIDLNYSTELKTVMIPNDNPETFKIVQKKYGADFLVMPAPRNFLNNFDKDSLFSLIYTDAYSDLKLYKIK